LLLLPCVAVCEDLRVEIVPANPRYMEAVYARITPSSIDTNFFGASTSMSGSTIAVKLFTVIDLGPTPIDVFLGRFPAGRFNVQVSRGDPVEGTAQFTVAPQAAASSDLVPAVDFTGLWWNSRESGWGLEIFQGPTYALFATWHVYDADGKPTWYVLSGGHFQGNRLYVGDVYRTTGPFFGATFDPARVTETRVGTGVLSFSTFDTGNLSFTIDGQRTNKAIVRFPVE
jgi:hypothetical protein